MELRQVEEIIYDRINKRVDEMMENGLLGRSEKILPYQNRVALQTVGYTELFKYLDGEWDLDFAIAEIKKKFKEICQTPTHLD